jgi:polyene macrolide polyketide synthase
MARLSVGAELGDRGVFAPALRRDRDQLTALLGCLGVLHTAGVDVDWAAFFAGRGARPVDLPRYAFQRERYWLDVDSSGGLGDLSAAGLGTVDHPLLSAALPSPGGGGTSFTCQVSLASHRWLRDHAVFDRVLFPGTAFAELLLAAGRELGCEVVEEMTLEAPLVLAEGDEVHVQVVAGDDDGDGRREVEVYSRAPIDAEPNGHGTDWVRHAAGVVSAQAAPAGDAVRALGGEAWPPADAEPVDVAALYDALADAGFGYGPAFQGVVAAWRRGDEAFCELALDADLAEDAAGFGVHPALLDASLHAVLDGLREQADGQGIPVPVSMRGIRVHRAGAAALRVRVEVAEDGRAVSLAAVDAGGQPVLEVDSVAVRPIDAERLGAPARVGSDSLFRTEWAEVALERDARPSGRYAVVGGGLALADDVPRHADLDALVAAAADFPDVVFVSATDVAASDDAADGGAAAGRAREGVAALLSFLQGWLAVEVSSASRLVLVTRGAMAVAPGEAPDPARAALWGLVRSAQAEHPGRFTLVDLDERADAAEVAWPSLLATDEPQLAVRRGGAYALRLARLHTASALTEPDGVDAWHLDAPRRGTLEDLALVESPHAKQPLGPEEIRVAVRAGGLNFRDVLIALGQYPGGDPIGSEAAGVVLEVGEDVADLAVGDRVMGPMPGGVGPVTVADRRLVANVPDGWSDAEAASVPIAFMTAYFGLRDLGGLQEGQTVLVHAGAGGVGMAALQIARHLGAEVYATASPAKWDVLRGLGLDDDHIASSRDLDFRDRFLEATDGKGVDLVLNALAGEYVDASLALLPRGGRFIELGKADVRDADQVARDHPGVEYRAFDLIPSAGRDRAGEMLTEIVELFEAGALRHSPIQAWDVRHAPEAFRFLGDGRNVGKVVLTVPRALDADGTVLITGGTGDLARRIARHLATEHGVRHLLLVSRRGEDAPGATEIVDELRGLGAEPRVAACDVADRDAVSALLDAIDADHPLTAVVHTAGVLDDAVVESLTAEQVERVMRPKADAAQVLDELIVGTDLAELILFSSQSGVMGPPGQGNYAAANAFLDALAERRRAQGRPATSLAWGLWSDASGLAGQLDEADVARLARLGVAVMRDELALFDAGRASAEAVVVPTRLEMAALRSAAEAGTLPPLLRDLVRGRPRRERDAGRTLDQELAGVPDDEREDKVLEAVSEEVAAVLGNSADSVDPDETFKDLGFDSLAAVELRNRLVRISGQRLPSTLIFDHPSPVALARYLLTRLEPAPAPASNGGEAREVDEADIRRLLASLPVDRLRDAGLLDPLVRLAEVNGDDDGEGREDRHRPVEELDADELIRLANEEES